MNKPLKEYLDYLKLDKNYSEQTISSYCSDIEKFFSYIDSEGVLFDEVSNITIRNFLDGELNNDISKRSCKRRLSALKGFYLYLKKKQYIQTNPFLTIKSPKMEKTYPKTLFEEQINAIFEANSKRDNPMKIRDQAIIEVLYFTGIRASELVNIKIQDFNLKRRTLRVVGKGNKERQVPFSEECKQSIEIYLNELRPNLLKKALIPSPFLFLNTKGNQLTRRGLQYILKEIEDDCLTVSGIHPHLFRHTFATTLLQNGLDLRDIQELLGHESLNSTQVYSHISDKTIQETYLANFPRARKK